MGLGKDGKNQFFFKKINLEGLFDLTSLSPVIRMHLLDYFAPVLFLG